MGCRSFLQGWIDPKTGEDVEDGRMNLGVVTVNVPRIALESHGDVDRFWRLFDERMETAHQALQFRIMRCKQATPVVTVNVPRIALESHGDVDRFWRLFDERMETAHQALQFRIMRCKQATPVNAPTLFRYGAFGRLDANDNVDQLFRNERATVSLGYIGLYEATAVFYGKNWMRDHGWDPQGKEFALEIVRRMNQLCKDWSAAEGYHYSVYSTPAESLTDRFNRIDRDKFGFALEIVRRMNQLCKDWSAAEGYHYSVYSTPAESLTDRFNRIDRDKFGEVEGVTDHDFYTNSFHYPVWLQPTPMEKLDYEKDFPYYASGGFINYCEFPCLRSTTRCGCSPRRWRSSTTRRTSRTTLRAASSTTASSRACRPTRRRSKPCGITRTTSASATSARTRRSTTASNAASKATSSRPKRASP